MQMEVIPTKMHADVIASYWTMMQELESKANNDDDRLLKVWVEGFYRQWNEMTGDNKHPIWVKD